MWGCGFVRGRGGAVLFHWLAILTVGPALATESTGVRLWSAAQLLLLLLFTNMKYAMCSCYELSIEKKSIRISYSGFIVKEQWHIF